MPKRKILVTVCAISGLIFALSCYKVVSIMTTNAKEESAFQQLSAMVEQAEAEMQVTVDYSDVVTPEIKTPKEPSAPSVLPEYAGVYAQNSDFFAWLSIDNTPINYPVMQSPAEPQFYLNHAFDKTSSNTGTPFLDSACTTAGGIYIVYGHHTNNGSMFGALPNYEDKSYWEQHKTIRFDTLYEHGEYEVIAAFRSRIYAPEHKGFRYYEYTDLSYEVTFNSYLEQVMESALYDTGVTAQFGDTLLVLSTCNYHIENGRFVVVARKKK